SATPRNGSTMRRSAKRRDARSGASTLCGCLGCREHEAPRGRYAEPLRLPHRVQIPRKRRLPPCSCDGVSRPPYWNRPAAAGKVTATDGPWGAERAPSKSLTQGFESMSRVPSLSSPFLLGFDEIERALDRVSKAADGYPPYN